MVRILVSVLVAASVVAVIGAQDPPQEQPPQPSIFRGGSELVRAYVTVTDKDGRLVTTLRKDDFELRDEGKPQPIAVFDASPRAIRLIVMLDVSCSMESNLALMREGTIELVKSLRPVDRARIGTFGKDVAITPTFTRDVRELLAGLPTAIDQAAPTPLWRAVGKAVDSFEPAEGDEIRRVVLVLSDGGDSGFTLGARFVSAPDVIADARRQDVMVYGVGIRGRGRCLTSEGPRIVSTDFADPALAKVAGETGGGYTELRPGENIGLAFARVAEELRSQYLLGFDPPRRDGKVHDIEIKVNQSGMKPRARKSYVAPKG